MPDPHDAAAIECEGLPATQNLHDAAKADRFERYDHDGCPVGPWDVEGET